VTRLRSAFSGYFRLQDADVLALWDIAHFSFDANVLLKLYRFQPTACERFFEILGRLGDRVWLTHQASEEYHRHRLAKINEQLAAYSQLDRELNLIAQRVDSLASAHDPHPYLDVRAASSLVKGGVQEARRMLKEARSAHADLTEDDPILDRLTATFRDLVGEPYRGEELDRVLLLAEQRFHRRLPPGYADEGKGGSRQYGDVMVWFQLLDHARDAKRPIIFVSDDTKEDWWIREGGESIAARPELRQEMLEKVGVEFVMYPTVRFMRDAEVALDLVYAPNVIEEVQAVSAVSPVGRPYTDTNSGAESDQTTPPEDMQAWPAVVGINSFVLYVPGLRRQLTVTFDAPYSDTPLVSVNAAVRPATGGGKAVAGWAWHASGLRDQELFELSGFVSMDDVANGTTAE
jgi:hypothetical protein